MELNLALDLAKLCRSEQVVSSCGVIVNYAAANTFIRSAGCTG